jgi:hypothetical protein
MADEKKKPDLKARLNRTQVGQNLGAGVVAPPDASAPAAVPAPPGLEGIVAPPVAAADDLAVPDFIRQQMAEKAAAEARSAAEARAATERAAQQAKVQAAAADPFAASETAASAQAQDIKLFVDGREVSDDEVGRQKTGSRVGLVVVGVVALGAGLLFGDLRASKREAERATGAITAVRQQVDTAGAIVATLKERVEQAATAAGVPTSEGENQPAPTAQATVNEELASWFASQPPEPPFSETAYAGRVGRLRPEVVEKLMKFHIEINETWAELRRHTALSQGGQLTLIRASLNDLTRVRGEFQRMMVVFNPGTAGGPPVLGTLVFAQPGEGGNFTITPVPQRTQPTRTMYTAGDLAATMATVGVPVSVQAGIAPQVVRGLTAPWNDYVTRLRRLRSLADQLQQDHRALSQALNTSAAAH